MIQGMLGTTLLFIYGVALAGGPYSSQAGISASADNAATAGSNPAGMTRFEWRWKDNRTISASLNYLEMGEAPVTSPSIPVVGSITGQYTDRQTIWLQVGMNFGDGPR